MYSSDMNDRGEVVATPDDLRRILEKLAGQPAPLSTCLPESAVRVLAPDGSGLGYSQLNELLLLLGFDRITHSFFQFLVDGTTEYQDGASIKSFAELKAAVDRFRELGILHFGNVKYAFKLLSRNTEELESRVVREIPAEHFKRRHDPIRPIESISPERTYYLGYVIERELHDRLQANPADAEAQRLEQERQEAVDTGRANQEAYLASDHLDVYVATSMRQRHEFLTVSQLTREIFGHPELSELKLRGFDPTQAYCKDRIDKGLSEALMLRRAECTIYLAQESDTLGKDSELASTLAQGKPVIVFVPGVDEGFAARLISELQSAYPERDVRDLLLEQLQIFEPSAAWKDQEVRSWIDNPSPEQVPDIQARLQQAILKHYNKRAETLQETHPLGIQVNLATGVANGVLVVRTADHCAKLVRRILTRTLQFRVTEENGAIVLREAISKCVFRIATGDLMLTNAFWNFYREPAE